MNCDAVVKSIPFYFYGEVAPDAEDAIEEHIQACAPCREEWERQKALASALDRHALAPPPELLAECRHDLARAIYREESPEVRRSASDPWGLFRVAPRYPFPPARGRGGVACSGILCGPVHGHVACRRQFGGLHSRCHGFEHSLRAAG